jgi:hypothetical protein
MARARSGSAVAVQGGAHPPPASASGIVATRSKGVEASRRLRSMYQREDEMQMANVRPMMEYVGKAMAAAQGEG